MLSINNENYVEMFKVKCESPLSQLPSSEITTFIDNKQKDNKPHLKFSLHSKNGCISAELAELMQVLNSEQGWQHWSCKLIRSHLYIECQIGCPDLKGEIDKLLTRREATRI